VKRAPAASLLLTNERQLQDNRHAGSVTEKVTLALNGPVPSDMLYPYTLPRKYLADQESAVTHRRILLTAENGNTVLLHTPPKSLQAYEEERRIRHSAIEHVTFSVIILIPHRPAAQLAAQEHVLYSSMTDAVLKRRSVKLGGITGKRGGPNISQHINVMSTEKVQKTLEVVS
jgi:hypothetical protein